MTIPFSVSASRELDISKTLYKSDTFLWYAGGKDSGKFCHYPSLLELLPL
jgi:hypothetical protein